MATSSSSSPPESSPQQLSTPVSKQLAAPAGWLKKIASTESGGTPRRGAVYFIAPDGKEIKSKRSLEGYLKSNPGGPSASEFDWSTGETPRRSSRLGVTTPVASPESGAGNRRVRRKVAVEDEAPPEADEAMAGGAVSAKTEEAMEGVEERDVVELVEPVEKPESATHKEVEKIVGKPEDYEINECVPEANSEEVKNVECVLSEAKTDEPQTLGSLSEAGLEGKQANGVVLEENGPEEELVKQEEFGGEKGQMEAGKPDKVFSVMEEKPIELVSKAKHDDEVTHNGNLGTLQTKDTEEGSEKGVIGLAQLSEAPEVPRPNGTSV